VNDMEVSMSIPSYPKILALGNPKIANILSGEVEITEKVDGSMFAFGRIAGRIDCRSKGVKSLVELPQQMFQEAVDLAYSLQENIPEGYVFYGEWLQKPKHNSLAYTRRPQNGLALWAVSKDFVFLPYNGIQDWADLLGVDVVPLLHRGQATTEQVMALLDRESYLGGQKIEGVVVKNYAQPFFLYDTEYTVTPAKYVSEKFKEVNKENWKKHSGNGPLASFMESFCTEARWEKAVQHLRESGKLESDPRDIAALIKEVHCDIEKEEEEAIRDWLYRHFSKDIKRTAVRGLPEWYKRKLVESL